ncbi:ferredoxin--NADP reductase [Pseudooceanicola sp. GBMRC 2024]|uniref:ferredoxin--NADP(+) reductase n=1 Tax=Pseudooceanicola albus TaxID=2692189 RepID=A0A6L7G249_9RHOB|nr:ferredoxin--NADP reductase [Pseudooceanicola albus]MXN17812.1 ferredoxin--NADP reductase [Pseudooceanicola albus]
MAILHPETVLSVHHWTDRLFSFTTTRDPGMRFSNGHFTMIGLNIAGRPLLRAYSIASANHAAHLEFFSIKVPDGPLTSRLQHLEVGDQLLVGRKPTGTLLIDHLRAGRVLYLLATGTGLAPFLSVIRDPETYLRFEQVVLVHGVRQVADLAYREGLARGLADDPLMAEVIDGRLTYLPTVTREAFARQGRITTLIGTGQLEADAGLPPLCPTRDRVMICGSTGLNRDLAALLEARGFREGNTTSPGDYVVEKAFVEG